MILEIGREMSRGGKTPLPINLNRFELSYRPSLPTEKKEKKSNWTSIERKMSLTTSLPLSLSHTQISISGGGVVERSIVTLLRASTQF